jgi:drug/metabolite transporter superfamily protein YnfA
MHTKHFVFHFGAAAAASATGGFDIWCEHQHNVCLFLTNCQSSLSLLLFLTLATL